VSSCRSHSARRGQKSDTIGEDVSHNVLIYVQSATSHKVSNCNIENYAQSGFGMVYAFLYDGILFSYGSTGYYRTLADVR